MVDGANQTRRPRRVLTYKTLPPGADYSPPQIRKLIITAGFPAPIQLSPKGVGFFEDEVLDWIATRPRVKRNSKPRIKRASDAQRQSPTADQGTHSDRDGHDLGETQVDLLAASSKEG